MGKPFEKQIKIIEDEWDKHIKAIQDQGKIKLKNILDDEDTPFISKQK